MSERPWSGPGAPRRVLAIRLQAFGDTVLTLPYLSALRRLLPDATLDFLTRPEVAEVPKGIVLFDRVHELSGGRARRWQMLGALALAPRLRARSYDVVVDLQNNHVSRLVRRLMAPRAWSEFDRASPRLAGERTRTTIEAAGFGPLHVRPDLVPRHPEAGAAVLRAAGWDGTSDLVVLNPAGATAGRAWPLDAYARFAAAWSDQANRPTRFVVLGLPKLASRARALAERIGPTLLNLVGRTTGAEALGVVRRATLVVSEDSGLMHLAWAAGTPTLGLFGASKGAWARPHGSHASWVRACARADGACLEGRCRNGTPTCLDRVAADLVLGQARELVRRVADEPGRIYVDGRAYAPPLEG